MVHTKYNKKMLQCVHIIAYTAALFNLFPSHRNFAHFKMAALPADAIALPTTNLHFPRHHDRILAAMHKYKATVKAYRQVISLCRNPAPAWAAVESWLSDEMEVVWQEYQNVCADRGAPTIRLGSSWASVADDIANLGDLGPDETDEADEEDSPGSTSAVDHPEDYLDFFTPSRIR